MKSSSTVNTNPINHMAIKWDLEITSKNLTGKSPLDFKLGQTSGSLKLVRKANLPSLEQHSHVPPATRSLPPKILFSPSPHHDTASVGLPSKKKPLNTMNQMEKKRYKNLKEHAFHGTRPCWAREQARTHREIAMPTLLCT